MDYSSFGFIAVGILIVGLTLLTKKWQLTMHATFSQHAAQNRAGIIYYIVLFSIVLPLLALFFFGWFMTRFDLPLAFGVCIAIALIAQYLCALVPETGGVKTSVHQGFAVVSAFSLFPSIVILSFNRSITLAAVIIAIVGAVSMAYVIFTTLRQKMHPKYLLILQAVYFASFFLPILFISYT